jgi:hypothetical protein
MTIACLLANTVQAARRQHGLPDPARKRGRNPFHVVNGR